MPFSSGTFSLYSTGNPVVTGTTIASTWANNTLNDLATGLTTCVLKDGTQTITANMPFGGFKITGYGSSQTPSARTDVPAIVQLQDSTTIFAQGASGAVTCLASLTPAITSYVSGRAVIYYPPATNTSSYAVNLNSAGNRNVFANGAALTGGEVLIGVPALIFDDGTQFNLLNPNPNQLPINSQSAAYQLVAGDAGKMILHPAADTNARTFTIPSNATVPYAPGTILTIVNETANVVTIAITTDTMTLAGTTTTGSRALAQNGIATAVKKTSTSWLINGTGLS